MLVYMTTCSSQSFSSVLFKTLQVSAKSVYGSEWISYDCFLNFKGISSQTHNTKLVRDIMILTWKK